MGGVSEALEKVMVMMLMVTMVLMVVVLMLMVTMAIMTLMIPWRKGGGKSQTRRQKTAQK